MANAYYGSYADNIIAGLTPTGTAASTGYSLATMARNEPARRVRYGSGTITQTYTRGSSARGDVAVLPMHNLSGSVLTITNGTGLSVAVTIPTARVNGFPETLVVDLEAAQPNATTRTSTTWNWVVAGNASNVIFGGGIGIYAKNTFERNFAWSFQEVEGSAFIEHTNDYGMRHVYDLNATKRRVELQVLGTEAQRGTLRNFFRGNHGAALPGFLWIDPSDSTTGYYGYWQPEQSTERRFTAVNAVQIVFTECSKGVSLV